MAILVDFQRVREDKQEIEYSFGDAGNLGRRLVITKQSRESRPLDGTPDKDYTKVLMKILAFHDREASWPEKGTYAA